MSEAPQLFDPKALTRNRARAAAAPEMFLHEIAADEIKHRLSMVNKSFNASVIVTGHGDFWQHILPDAVIVSADEVLKLEPRAHDLIIHAMALHWANDPVGQMIQCLHALKPDGLFMAVMFGGQTLHELRATLAEAEAQVSGGLSPRVAPMSEIRDMGALLQRAGFALPVIDSLPIKTSYKSLTHLMHELRAMGERNALHGRVRHFTRPSLFTAAEALYRRAFAAADSRIEATFELLFLLGWAPDATQPKPLRPGSASARLADALGSLEMPLKD
ncbi:SAM-dependent methyltransferase [Rhodobacteraceae bacterium D3-12]|nr:SAM-dependent methyltransferase [Rhodobacteraceae bacterium D3-12]